MGMKPNSALPQRRALVYARLSASALGIDDQIKKCLSWMKMHAPGAVATTISSQGLASESDPKLAAALDQGVDLLLVEDLNRLPGPEQRRILRAAARGKARIISLNDNIDTGKSSA